MFRAYKGGIERWHADRDRQEEHLSLGKVRREKLREGTGKNMNDVMKGQGNKHEWKEIKDKVDNDRNK